MMINKNTEPLYETISAFAPGCEQEEKEREIMLRLLTTETDLLTRENGLYHFTASAWTLNTGRTKVLMVYHNIYNAWSWVGGHADGESDLFSVARRELKEETGLSVACPLNEEPLSLEIIGVQAHFKNGAFISPHLHLNLTYGFTAAETQPLKIKPDENKGVAWHTINEIKADPKEPYMQPIYGKLMDRTMK